MTYLLGKTAQEAAVRTVALQNEFEARLAPLWQSETERAMRAMLSEYEATGRIPNADIDHEPRMAEIWGTMAQIAVAAFGGRVVDESKSRGLVLETKSFAEFFARLASEYIQAEAIRRRITMVSNTTRTQVIRLIEAGQQSGDTLPDIAKNVSDAIPGIARNRAAIIARTEVHGASNYASNEAAKATGLELEKEWVSVADLRTRSVFLDDEFDHRQMNGVKVPMDQPFMVMKDDGTKEPLMFCGDPDGSAGNIINCRCRTVHSVVGLDD